MKSLPDVLVSCIHAAGSDQRRTTRGLHVARLVGLNSGKWERWKRRGDERQLQFPAAPTVAVPRLVVPLNTVTVAPASPLPVSDVGIAAGNVGAAWRCSVDGDSPATETR